MLTHHIAFKTYVPILRNDNACDSSYISCEIFVAKNMVLINVIVLTGEVGGWGPAQKNVRGEIGGWGRVPFNETYAPSLSTIYDGA